MADAVRKLPPLMTAAEFRDWPGDGTATCYELVDGVLRAMATTSDTHGTIHTSLTTEVSLHLRATRPGCRVVSLPGIAPRLRADWNHRIPELGVTCAPNRPGQIMAPDTFLLIEVLSPGNASDTWSNIPLYASVPSVEEILVVHSTAVKAELLRRRPDQSWPDNPDVVAGLVASIRLTSIDMLLPMAQVYRNTHLAAQPR
jgi:Uma2 family endonuclease